MERVGKFEKVSYEQFSTAMSGEFRMDDETIRNLYDRIELPSRATSGSAGYDFKAPMGFVLAPGKTIKIPTGIRVKMNAGWWLACVPRSGLGFKYRMQFDNTIGVIDEDYYGSDNEGHIFVKITNDTHEDKNICIRAGDGFMQAIFLPYGITYDDNVDAVRNGGIGSTDLGKMEQSYDKVFLACNLSELKSGLTMPLDHMTMLLGKTSETLPIDKQQKLKNAMKDYCEVCDYVHQQIADQKKG